MDSKSKRYTIKDIAKEAGVSVATVHCALYNKPGVSSVVKEKILQIAREHDYKINLNASLLKRKNLRIAAVFPSPVEEKRYYYQEIWAGIHDYVQNQNDFGVDLIEIAYFPEKEDAFQALLRTVKLSEVDGVLIAPDTDFGTTRVDSAFFGQNIPLVLVGSDAENIKRLFCIQPHFVAVGKMIAELLISQMRRGNSILICAGNREAASHYLIIQGCYQYIKENGLDVNIIPIYGNDHSNIDYNKIVEALKNDENIGACCSVNARASVQLAKALEESGLAGKIPAVGSDIFTENLEALKRGTFSNLINKNQYNQILNALKYIVEFLAKDMLPPTESLFSRCDLVFRSTVELYEDNGYRLLL